jgi:hypothetical protein
MNEPVSPGQEVELEEVELEPSAVGPFVRHTGRKAAFAVIEWLAHCLVVGVLLVGMRGLEALVKLLWPRDQVLFLGIVPIHQLFSTADFLLLVAVLVLGVGCVVKAYRGAK